MNLINELMPKLAAQRPDAEVPLVELTTGDVTNASVSPPLIQVGHSTTAVACPVLGSYTPVNGDHVTVLIAGGTRICLGVIGELPIAFPFAAGWGNLGGGNPDCEYYRVGGNVYLHGAAQRTGAATGAANVTVGTLPVGFRPADGLTHRFVVSGTNPTPGGQIGLVNVSGAGVVTYLGVLSGSIAQTTGFIMLDGVSFRA